MNRKSLSIVIGIAAAVLAPATIHAAAMPVFAYSGGGATTQVRSGAGLVVGSLVRIGANDVSVSALGVQAVAASNATVGGALPADVQMAIWSSNSTGSTGNLLNGSSVSVSSNVDALGAGGYWYHSLSTPVTLTAGQYYLIGALLATSQPTNFFEANWTGSHDLYSATGTDVAWLSNQYKSSSTLVAPTTASGSPNDYQRWGAANMLITIPEPAALGVVALSGLCILAARRRQRAC